MGAAGCLTLSAKDRGKLPTIAGSFLGIQRLLKRAPATSPGTCTIVQKGEPSGLPAALGCSPSKGRAGSLKAVSGPCYTLPDNGKRVFDRRAFAVISLLRLEEVEASIGVDDDGGQRLYYYNACFLVSMMTVISRKYFILSLAMTKGDP